MSDYITAKSEHEKRLADPDTVQNILGGILYYSGKNNSFNELLTAYLTVFPYLNDSSIGGLSGKFRGSDKSTIDYKAIPEGVAVALFNSRNTFDSDYERLAFYYDYSRVIAPKEFAVSLNLTIYPAEEDRAAALKAGVPNEVFNALLERELRVRVSQLATRQMLDERVAGKRSERILLVYNIYLDKLYVWNPTTQMLEFTGNALTGKPADPHSTHLAPLRLYDY